MIDDFVKAAEVAIWQGSLPSVQRSWPAHEAADVRPDARSASRRLFLRSRALRHQAHTEAEVNQRGKAAVQDVYGNRDVLYSARKRASIRHSRLRSLYEFNVTVQHGAASIRVPAETASCTDITSAGTFTSPSTFELSPSCTCPC